jgi:hypothetical protein
MDIAVRRAIDAQEECEQYRALGTPASIASALTELAQYKADEKAGLRPKLLCTIGTPVWYLDLNCMEIHELRVQGISINYNGFAVYHLGDWVAVSEKQFGQVWFTSRDAAEAALKGEAT